MVSNTGWCYPNGMVGLRLLESEPQTGSFILGSDVGLLVGDLFSWENQKDSDSATPKAQILG